MYSDAFNTLMLLSLRFFLTFTPSEIARIKIVFCVTCGGKGIIRLIASRDNLELWLVTTARNTPLMMV